MKTYQSLSLWDRLLFPFDVLTFTRPFGLEKDVFVFVFQTNSKYKRVANQEANRTHNFLVIKYFRLVVWTLDLFNRLCAEEGRLNTVCELELYATHSPVSFRIHYLL